MRDDARSRTGDREFAAQRITVLLRRHWSDRRELNPRFAGVGDQRVSATLRPRGAPHRNRTDPPHPYVDAHSRRARRADLVQRPLTMLAPRAGNDPATTISKTACSPFASSDRAHAENRTPMLPFRSRAHVLTCFVGMVGTRGLQPANLAVPNGALCQAELHPDGRVDTIRTCIGLAARGGIEPPIFRLTTGRCAELSYLALVETRRVELLWNCLQGRRMAVLPRPHLAPRQELDSRLRFRRPAPIR